MKGANASSRIYAYDKKGLLLTQNIRRPGDLSSVSILDKYMYSFWD
jgi:hypothetical protein